MRLRYLIPFLLLGALAHSQTINPNQIRPATQNGYVLTTTTANQPPSWQPGSNPVFQTNSVNNHTQGGLNLVQGTGIELLNTSGDTVEIDANGNSELPPPFPIPAGQAVAWAFPTNCVAGPASPSNNGIAICGTTSGYVSKYFSSPLGNCCWSDKWTGFAMPTLPSDAVIQGMYGVMVMNSQGSDTILNSACGAPGSEFGLNTPGDLPFSGEYFGGSFGTTSGALTGADCLVSLDSSLGPASVFRQITVAQVAVAIYYTTANPPSLLNFQTVPTNVTLQTGGTQNSNQGLLNIAATPPITATYNGTNSTVTIACPSCGSSSGGTNVSVNGGAAIGNVNLNGTTPTAGTNGINVTWQVSSSNVSAEIVGDGNANHFLNGTGTWTTPTAGTGSVTDGAGTTTAGLISESTTTLHGIDYNSLLDNGHTTANTLTYSGTGGLSLTGGTAHQITIAEEVAPANPSAGSEKIYADSTTHLLSCLTSTGASCMPSGGGGSGFPITLGSTSIASGSTTTTLTGFASLGSAVFAGTGSTQTVMNYTAGTAAAAAPAHTIQVGAPLSVPTSYSAFYPSATPSDSGGDMWVLPSGGGTGTWKPYLPQQIQQVVIGASTSSVTFSSIPNTYTSLLVVFSGATDGANEDTPEFQFNGDTATHYDQAGVFTGTGGGFTPGGFGQTAVTNFGVGGIIPVYNSSTPFAGGGSCTIANYTGPFYKTIHCESGGWQTTATMGQLVNTWGQWRGAAAITSITFFSGLTQNFHPGTTVTLYGLP